MTAAAPASDRPRPDFTLEAAARAALGAEIEIAGVDEVGRGPLAGPVIAAAAILTDRAARRLAELGLDDSKRLSPGRREALGAELARLAAAGALRFALGAASVSEIERRNIRGATMLAMARAVARLGPPRPALALVDGRDAPDLGCPSRAVIGGDGRSLSIAAAALAAKLVRDRAMTRLAARHPAYAWERNMGYASAAHRAALAEVGPTAHHRALFCRNALASSKGGPR